MRKKGYFSTVFSSALNSHLKSDTNATRTTLNSDVIITCKYVKDMCSLFYKLYSCTTRIYSLLYLNFLHDSE